MCPDNETKRHRQAQHTQCIRCFLPSCEKLLTDQLKGGKLSFCSWSQETSVHHGRGCSAGGAEPSMAVEAAGSWSCWPPQQTGSQESSSRNPKLVSVSRACHQGMTQVNQLGPFMVKGSTESQNNTTSRGPHMHEPMGGIQTLWVGRGQGVHFTLKHVIRAYYRTHGERMLTGTLSFTSA